MHFMLIGPPGNDGVGLRISPLFTTIARVMVQFLVLPSKEAMAPLTVPVEISDGREARDA